MERLTFKKDGLNAFNDKHLGTYGRMQRDGKIIYIGPVADKLAEYEDLEEQLEKYHANINVKSIVEYFIETIFKGEKHEGFCVLTNEDAKEFEKYKKLTKHGKLPCAVGDIVYEVCEGFIEPCTVEVIFLADYRDKEGKSSYMAEIHYDREDCPYVSREIFFTEIGKTVFLAREEAEAALKELGKG